MCTVTGFDELRSVPRVSNTEDLDLCDIVFKSQDSKIVENSFWLHVFCASVTCPRVNGVLFASDVRSSMQNGP